MLLAQDVMLLLLDPDSGRLRTSYGEAVIGGALLAELALAGAVDVDEKTSRWRARKVRVTSLARPGDPLLAAALDRIAQKPRAARDLVPKLGKKQVPVIGARLAEAGQVRLVENRVLGIFPRRRWPVVSTVQRDTLVRRAIDALGTPTTADERTRALVALTAAGTRIDKLLAVPGLSRRDVRRRARDLVKGEWAAAAVRDAIEASQAAAISVAAASGAVSASG